MTVHPYGQAKIQTGTRVETAAVSNASSAPAVDSTERKAVASGVQAADTRVIQAKQTDAEATQRAQPGPLPSKPSRSRSVTLPTGPPRALDVGQQRLAIEGMDGQTAIQGTDGRSGQRLAIEGMDGQTVIQGGDGRSGQRLAIEGMDGQTVIQDTDRRA